MITPLELKSYSEFETVLERNDERLEQDILEATVEIESIVGYDFSDYEEVPQKAKLAALKMAQFYALINSDEAMAKGYKSEKIGDYSYTLADGTSIRKPDVYHLLAEYIHVDQVDKGNIKLRMRAL